ncbi:hypothetical protein E2C01_011464 [Portunus trituberculatus]|uniref:Uncharacterized protein n=1 Tax=Portunus trituberculatus TaxID=210409 RepID=A0A5B7DBZ1_PORTR|nr:hypothetical protein [Portunus trituberculatus]
MVTHPLTTSHLPTLLSSSSKLSITSLHLRPVSVAALLTERRGVFFTEQRLLGVYIPHGLSQWADSERRVLLLQGVRGRNRDKVGVTVPSKQQATDLLAPPPQRPLFCHQAEFVEQLLCTKLQSNSINSQIGNKSVPANPNINMKLKAKSAGANDGYAKPCKAGSIFL